jgi:hypothetical protein
MTGEKLVLATELPPKIEDVSFGYVHSAVATTETYGTFDVSGDTPELLEASRFREEQKNQFLSDEIRNPVLNRCPKFVTNQEQRRSMFLEVSSVMYAQTLRRDQGATETVEDELLDRLVAQRINELGFVETAASISLGNLDSPTRESMAQSLKTASRDIYGLPDRNRSLSLIQARITKAQQLAESDNAELKTVRDYILESWDTTTVFDLVDPAKLDEESIEFYEGILKEELNKAVDYAFEPYGKKDIYTPEEMEDVFNRYIEIRDLKETGWKAEVVKGRTQCASQQDTKIVEIGDKRTEKNRTYDRVLESLLHEVEKHVGSNVRGSKLGSGLAGVGLPSYTLFEEPFAAAVPELFVGTSTTNGGTPYVIGIALSVGYDGRERDFRDGFELMWRLSLVEDYKANEDVSDQITAAREEAYMSLIRLWRGMPTDVPGCVFTKDRAYEPHDVLTYLHNDGDHLPRGDFLRLLQAKYDPRQPDQDEYIRTLTK